MDSVIHGNPVYKFNNMKSPLTISIPKPCSENWNTFTHSEKGGLCARCERHVVDFTKMRDDEIVSFFQANPTHTCGRFLPQQLKGYAIPGGTRKKLNTTFLKAGVLTTLLILAEGVAHGQERPVKSTTESSPTSDNAQQAQREGRKITGVVKTDYDDNSPLPGAHVFLKGTTSGTVTDASGAFEFPVPIRAGDVLIVQFIGFRTQEIVWEEKNPSYIEIIMGTEYLELMGEVATTGIYQEKKPSFWSKVKSIF
jgi:hypothetical protein